MIRKTIALPAAAALLTSLLAGCGVEPADGEGIVVGTTDSFAVTDSTPAPFDPAASYDVSAWNVMRNTFQTLLRIPRSGTRPVTDAAERCGFVDKQNVHYTCTLRKGLTFSNGHKLDARDVEYSVRRILNIRYANGPVSLLSGIKKVKATSSHDIEFRLKKSDATFPYKLATPAAAIVDSETYPDDGFIKSFKITGSGPYLLESLDDKAGKAVFTRNPDYKGGLKIRNERIELRFYPSSKAMEKALRDGDIDLMNRTISPKQVADLEAAGDDRVDLVEQPGQEIRYLVFNTEDETMGRRSVRRAMAEVIDRKELVRDVYSRTAEPLYSLVPSGVTGHRNSFFNEYGEPGKGAARDILEEAGVEIPVKMELAYTTDHYGSVTEKEFDNLEKQLDDSGLFEVKTKGVPWAKYRTAALEGKYEVYGYGWFPDFPDADNYIAPFFEKNNFLGSSYTNPEIRDQLIPLTRRVADRVRTADGFGRAQDIVAEEVPVLPLWQGKQFIAARDDITGVEWALNSSSVLQLWELGRSTDAG
ncbi:peptide/nickel transport system substrate-binding protein [Streptomyces sp. WMMB 714]|uniref:ABC transporter substrate-binding protein n=1 Tax=Streptomyces sp. WMMB 714 TaxID=1286822 RepID=UPI0005F76530|nr:ABC transporter substrate-binding protein [Streptomyces sp. WMMB 714]SCK41316.1 peptide/nickel transport system substrate-binding protein [Streptomyces sp. WMMB 714]